MRPDLQLALLGLDDDGRRQLRQRCGGNWNSVTVGEDGTFTVHVTPQPHTHPDGPSGHERMTAWTGLRQALERLADWLPGFRHWALAAALELLAAVVHVCRPAARWIVQELLVILRDALALFEREPPGSAGWSCSITSSRPAGPRAGSRTAVSGRRLPVGVRPQAGDAADVRAAPVTTAALYDEPPGEPCGPA